MIIKSLATYYYWYVWQFLQYLLSQELCMEIVVQLA